MQCLGHPIELATPSLIILIFILDQSNYQRMPLQPFGFTFTSWIRY